MASFRKPDLNAPRFRKAASGIIFWDLTLALKKKYPGKYNHLKQVDVKNIILAHNQNIQEAIIKERDGVELPAYLGLVKIVSCPSKVPYVNYGESIKQGVEVFHKNWETDGYNAKIFYSNIGRRYLVRDRTLWEFNAVRQFSRLVSKEYPKDWKKYAMYNWGNSREKTERLLDNLEYKEKLEIKNKEGLDIYNEFDMN